MTLKERILVFNKLFEDLINTSSRIGKEVLVNEFKSDYPECKEDLVIILETLDNKHPIGWTFKAQPHLIPQIELDNIWEVIQVCKSRNSTSDADTSYIENILGSIGVFIEPIVNRTLRLGIGKSLLVKDKLSPMLAKKYTGGRLRNNVVITEKLDGNRCLAYFDFDQNTWQFRSRNGKVMKVDFDMSNYPKEYIYDGEVMSIEQTQRSRARSVIMTNLSTPDYKDMGIGDEQLLFNKTSGLINSKGKNKNLIYNIFDIVSKDTYFVRRKILDELKELPKLTTRIVPVLYTGKDTEYINKMLDRMVLTGGEGLMLNDLDHSYENKRTNALLKYKKVQFCDMIVIDTYEGKGKYLGCCGGLICQMITTDGKNVKCEVGTGLSDLQRIEWGQTPEAIVGKIIQVGYHEMTQDRFSVNTDNYSLRFPRFVRIREDKNNTSEF